MPDAIREDLAVVAAQIHETHPHFEVCIVDPL